MNFKDAAYCVLRRERRPLSAKEVTEIALREGLIRPGGRTPHATMAARLYVDIKQQGERSRFMKVDRGLFGLNEYDEKGRKEETEGEGTFLGGNLIIGRLRETQFKSDSPADFEEAIRASFSFLGFEADLIGGRGETDVLLTANIGEESFKINVDGKTSRSGKITDRQIDWISLRDHRRKNNADFVVVVGPEFSGGNLEQRADEYDVSVLKTEDLARLVDAHSKFRFTLSELKDLFAGKGDRTSQLEDLLTQNLARRNLLEQFRIILEEMQSLQDRLGYFTFASLAGREKIEELDIPPQDVDYLISLLRLPFINAVKELSPSRYILTITIADMANIFQQISRLLTGPAPEADLRAAPLPEAKVRPSSEKKSGSNYFEWYVKGHSVVARARKDNPYEHYCPIPHLQSILGKVVQAFAGQNVINADLVFSMLEGQDLSVGRRFKGKPEQYKIRMALGILEIEGLVKWTGSKRPIEYKLNVGPRQIHGWIRDNIGKER